MEWESPSGRRKAGDRLGPLWQGIAAAILICAVLGLSVATGIMERELVSTPAVTATEAAPESTATAAPPTPTPQPAETLGPAPGAPTDSSLTIHTRRNLPTRRGS
jgi:hypothetical protein